MSLTLIIPSFNRAQQLDCLLRSLTRYWDISDLSIKVLYKYSDDKFKESYDKLFRIHWYVHPYMEYNFCRQIKEFIQIPSNMNRIIGFFTDDCVVYRKIPIESKEISFQLGDFNNHHCVSLRLGENTIIQNYLTGEQQASLLGIEKDNCVKFTYKRYNQYSNYGYLFSWDGCFYSKSWFFDNIENRNFENPRALEHQLNSDFSIRHKAQRYIICPKISCVFVNTVNAVQNNDIPAGTRYNYSPEYLNEKWLSGQRISLESFEGLELHSSHEEFPLIFEDYDGLDS